MKPDRRPLRRCERCGALVLLQPVARSFVQVTQAPYLLNLQAWQGKQAVQGYLQDHPPSRAPVRGEPLIQNVAAHEDYLRELVGQGWARVAHVLHTCSNGWATDPAGCLTKGEAAAIARLPAPPIIWPKDDVPSHTGARCKSCAAPLVFIKTRVGRKMPCNAGLMCIAVRSGGPDTVVTPDGRAVRGELVEPPREGEGYVTGHLAHWATCPHADAYRS